MAAVSPTMTQQDLESYLWGAAVILRGLVDAGDYKQFVFPLIFYKRLSDVWDEDYAAALKHSNDPVYANATANDRFVVPDGSRWNDVRAVAKDVGSTLQTALRCIEAANPGRLDGIFGDASWTNKERLPDPTLKNLIEHFSGRTLSLAAVPEDELGNAYEYLIKKFADDSGHTAQEFYTNRTVVHLMVRMLEPKPGERIYDPTCGTGGMLISALAEVKRKRGEHRTIKLFGQERNHMTASIARMNLALHGVEDSVIARGDTLAAPAFTENDRLKTFDIVLANPPYSIKQWSRESWASDPWGRNFLGIPPQGRADYAFFQHILRSLDSKVGRCAVLFPHGVLFRKEESDLRRRLIEADLVECVLGLGPNLFYNSPMEACIVIGRANKRPTQRGKILFVDAVAEVTRERAASFLASEQQAKIAAAYSNFTDAPGLAKVATIAEIDAQGWSLSIPLYVKRTGAKASKAAATQRPLAATWSDWETSRIDFRMEMDAMVEILERLDGAMVHGHSESTDE
jgi:type I restriction enzyme M protein